MDAAERATKVRVATRILRRQYTGNVAGLTTFSDNIATETQTSPVSVTSTHSDGGEVAGEITFPKDIWMQAAEDLLDDITFNPDAATQAGRVILPDYRFSTPA